MQITINETEIKQAIKKLVLSQISVAEGMNIDIELKATRGADGATAIIDISEPGSNADTVAVARRTPSPAPTPAATPAASPVAAQTKLDVAKKIQEAKATPETPAPAVSDGIAEHGEQQEDEGMKAQPEEPADPPAAETPAAAEEPAEPAPAKKSLFGGLKKPANPA